MLKTQLRLDHLKNKDWLQEREAQWQRVLIYEKTSEVSSKKEQDIFRDYFFSGNFDRFQKKLGKVRAMDAIRYFPANSLDHIKYITKIYWDYALENLNSRMLSRKDILFEQSILGTIGYDLTTSYIPNVIYCEVFHWLYGDKFEHIRTVDIGICEWAPTLTIDPTHSFGSLLTPVYRYLSQKGGDVAYQYVPKLMDYFYSVISLIDQKLISTDLVSKKTDPKTYESQIYIRKFFLYVLGYPASNEKHNSIDLEKNIKNWALDKSNNMPTLFLEFIDLLQEYKRLALKPVKKK